MILPMIAALFLIPFILDEMGEQTFGLLILLWSTISYITLLDFGMKRASVKFFAQNIGQEKEQDNKNLLITCIIFGLLVGCVIGGVLFISSDYFVRNMFDISSELMSTAYMCFRLIILFSPVFLAIPILTGFLQAYQKFNYLSFFNGLNGVLNYLIPATFLVISFSLFEIILALLVVKTLILISLTVISIKTLRKNASPDKSELKLFEGFKEIIKFGGWVSVSNFLTPFFEYADRFFIASLLTVSAVTIYAAPLEIILKVGMIAVSVSGVIFAAISNSSEHDPAKTTRILNLSLNVITALTFPIVITLVFFANEFLYFWIGSEIAGSGALVIQFVGIGILFKSSTNVSIAFLHAKDKTKLAAIIHLSEFVFYIILLSIFTAKTGVVGVAIIHSLRLIADNLLFAIFAQRNRESQNLKFLKNSTHIFLLTTLCIPAFFVGNIKIRITLWALIIGIYLYRQTKQYKSLVLSLAKN